MVNGMFWMGSQPWLKVNLEGQRFADEGAPYDFILHASSTQPGHTYCTIWDSNFMNYIPQFKTQGCSRMFPFENGAPVSAITLDANMGMIQQLTEGGMIQQADTIEELAKKLNIPAENFSATVSRYNGLVASGTDTDFGKLAFRMSPVDTPPTTASARPVTCCAPWTVFPLTPTSMPWTRKATPSRASMWAATIPVVSSPTATLTSFPDSPPAAPPP